MAASVGEHARLSPGSVINDRFTVLHELGCGNFAKVYCCRDNKRASPSDPELVAVKILKREYANDARYEADVLKAITAKNADRRHSVLTVQEHFNWGRYPVFVFPLKGPTLRQRRLGVLRGGNTPADVRAFAYEMLRALAFLHFDVRMIHTDLKPENILLDGPNAQSTVAGTGGIGSKWTIADFGSASFYRPEKLDSDLISTRPYRAPEVVLGGSWFYAADVWSMACIIFEVYTGTRLFDVHDDVTHLAQIEARLGPLPEALTSGLRHSRRFYSSTGKLMGRTTAASTTPSLAQALRGDPLLCDLLTSMLALDPKERLRADKALTHPYFEGQGAPRRSTPTADEERSVSPASLPPTTGRRPSVLPLSRAASPMIPSSATAAAPASSPTPTPLMPSSHVTTNSYAALKHAKLRRGLACGAPLPPSGRFTAAEAAAV